MKKTGIHFKTDVFAAVAVVDAKAPFCVARRRWSPVHLRALAAFQLLLCFFRGGGYPAGASAEERDVLLIRTPVDINYSLLGRVEASLFH